MNLHAILGYKNHTDISFMCDREGSVYCIKSNSTLDRWGDFEERESMSSSHKHKNNINPLLLTLVIYKLCDNIAMSYKKPAKMQCNKTLWKY